EHPRNETSVICGIRLRRNRTDYPQPVRIVKGAAKTAEMDGRWMIKDERWMMDAEVVAVGG
ncbi:MAG: hypothetical protein NWS49_10560, partial [Opitutales bacterium]|nr:hypothetical protein [Opitutales bacterium]